MLLQEVERLVEGFEIKHDIRVYINYLLSPITSHIRSQGSNENHILLHNVIYLHSVQGELFLSRYSFAIQVQTYEYSMSTRPVT